MVLFLNVAPLLEFLMYCGYESEALTRILHEVKYLKYFTSLANFKWKIRYRRLVFRLGSHTAYLKISRVKFYLRSRKFVLSLAPLSISISHT